jgi:putative acetyltransferase
VSKTLRFTKVISEIDIPGHGKMDDADLIVRSATNDDCERIQSLVFGVLGEYGLSPDTENTDRDISDIEKHYTARGGVFEIIETADGRLLGTIGLYPIDGVTVELRKMYFDRELRGRGWGKRMLSRMIERARDLGFKKIYLETASVLIDAIRLYERFGFRPTPEVHASRSDRGYVLKL